jgi:predicted TIM-barrel fold metal-dependent hydrolase
MIVDSHAHIFPPMGGAAGHRTAREHLRYIQHLLVFHTQPVRRAADNAVHLGQTLASGEGLTLADLAEVGFRGGGHGQFSWQAGDEEYYLQYLPPALADLACPPEMLIAQMDHAGVDRAVLHTGHAYGRLNRYLAQAVLRFPARFWGLAMIDEWRADQPDQVRAVRHAIRGFGLHALWFQIGSLRQHGREEPLDHPAFEPLWECVRELGIPVFWHIGTVRRGREAYLAELAGFVRWLERHPDIPCVWTHGLPLFRFMGADGRPDFPPEAWKPAEFPNVLMEILLPIFHGGQWEYPFVEARPVVREFYERFGPERLTWGSDMPNVERHCTYKQSLNYLRQGCDFIPPADMDLILGGNVLKLFR